MKKERSFCFSKIYKIYSCYIFWNDVHYIFSISLILKHRLIIHIKRQIIIIHDMKLLKKFWNQISSNVIIDNYKNNARKTTIFHKKNDTHIRKTISKIKRKVAIFKINKTLYKLSINMKEFCQKYEINYDS